MNLDILTAADGSQRYPQLAINGLSRLFALPDSPGHTLLYAIGTIELLVEERRKLTAQLVQKQIEITHLERERDEAEADMRATLEVIRDMPNYDQDNEHRLRHQAQMCLQRNPGVAATEPVIKEDTQ